MHTFGGEPLHSSIATPIADIRTPNHVLAGIIAPNMPSSNGTTMTCFNQREPMYDGLQLNSQRKISFFAELVVHSFS